MKGLSSLKPGAAIKTQLLVAALLWSAIGIFLVIRGLRLFEVVTPWPLVVAVAVGLVKSRLVLDRSAQKNIARILGREEGSCIGGVYSWRMWGFIVLMMLLGRFLRSSGLAGWIVGMVYVAVGSALFRSSRLLWQQWRATAVSS